MQDPRLPAAPAAAAALAGNGQDATQPVSGDLAARDAADAPVLRLAGYEGPLDALLDQARAGRVDLRQLPLLALVEQCAAAIDAALRALRRRRAASAAAAAHRGDGRGIDATDEGIAPAPRLPPVPPLERLGDWLVMAAWLAWLRTRLLLPEDDPQARAARAEVEALRRRIADRERVRDAVAWLDARPQLGRDVFACGTASEAHDRARERATAELAALLRAYTRRIAPVVPGQGRGPEDAAYRPRPPLIWRVPDALARIEPLLGTAPDPDAAAGVDLWRFLPGPAALEAAGLARDAVPDAALLDRSAAASTLVAGLELARQGQITLAQEESFGAITVHGRPGVAAAGQDAETALRNAS